MSGPFRFHGSTAGQYRWRYPTKLAAMELLGSGYFLDAADRCRTTRVKVTVPRQGSIQQTMCSTQSPAPSRRGSVWRWVMISAMLAIWIILLIIFVCLSWGSRLAGNHAVEEPSSAGLRVRGAAQALRQCISRLE